MLLRLGSTPMSEIERVPLATRKDFRLDWFSGTGAGGQNRNKVQACCRITHIPTGMVETGQNHRDRPSNQRDAFRRLAKRVVDHYLGEEQKKRWSAPKETVRTYHEPRNIVKNHRTGKIITYEEAMKDLSILIEDNQFGGLDEAVNKVVDDTNSDSQT